MARLMYTALASLTLVALAGCPEVDDTDPPTDTDMIEDDSVIVGTWVSAGADVAALLSAPPLNIVNVDADFAGDGSYLVTTTDDQGAELTFTGTFMVDESTVPHTIVLEQTSPTTVTSEGIFQVDAGVLTYEVAQTVPAVDGVTPPTVAAGFGSTSGGAFGTANVQTFR